MHSPPNRQIKDELRPIFHQIHALLVAARSVVPVVTFERRAHGKEVFDRNFCLASIGICNFALMFGQEAKNMFIDSPQPFVAKSNPNEDVSNAFGG